MIKEKTPPIFTSWRNFPEMKFPSDATRLPYTVVSCGRLSERVRRGFGHPAGQTGPVDIYSGWGEHPYDRDRSTPAPWCSKVPTPTSSTSPPGGYVYVDFRN